MQVALHSASGSVASAMGPHVPSVPLPFLVARQDSHVPAHALSQQTPSTHANGAHASAARPPHAAPSTGSVNRSAVRLVAEPPQIKAPPPPSSANACDCRGTESAAAGRQIPVATSYSSDDDSVFIPGATVL